MPRFGDWLRARIRRANRLAGGTEVVAVLRARALSLDVASIQTPDGQPWRGAAVAMMEIGLPSGVASFLAIADGTVSMYTSAGGGVIGAGEHASVRGAAERFRIVAADARRHLQVATAFPLPAPGEVRFHVRMGADASTAGESERSLATGRQPLSELYAAGQDLITEIRLISEGDKRADRAPLTHRLSQKRAEHEQIRTNSDRALHADGLLDSAVESAAGLPIGEGEPPIDIRRRLFSILNTWRYAGQIRMGFAVVEMPYAVQPAGRARDVA